MWEKTRVDGTRKLKGNAVPSVFFFSQQVAKRKAPLKRSSPKRLCKFPEIAIITN